MSSTRVRNFYWAHDYPHYGESTLVYSACDGSLWEVVPWDSWSEQDNPRDDLRQFKKPQDVEFESVYDNDRDWSSDSVWFKVVIKRHALYAEFVPQLQETIQARERAVVHAPVFIEFDDSVRIQIGQTRHFDGAMAPMFDAMMAIARDKSELTESVVDTIVAIHTHVADTTPHDGIMDGTSLRSSLVSHIGQRWKIRRSLSFSSTP